MTFHILSQLDVFNDFFHENLSKNRISRGDIVFNSLEGIFSFDSLSSCLTLDLILAVVAAADLLRKDHGEDQTVSPQARLVDSKYTEIDGLREKLIEPATLVNYFFSNDEKLPDPLAI